MLLMALFMTFLSGMLLMALFMTFLSGMLLMALFMTFLSGMLLMAHFSAFLIPFMSAVRDFVSMVFMLPDVMMLRIVMDSIRMVIFVAVHPCALPRRVIDEHHATVQAMRLYPHPHGRYEAPSTTPKRKPIAPPIKKPGRGRA